LIALAGGSQSLRGGYAHDPVFIGEGVIQSSQCIGRCVTTEQSCRHRTGGGRAILGDFLHDLDTPSGWTEQRTGGFFRANDRELTGILKLFLRGLHLAFDHAGGGGPAPGEDVDEYIAATAITHLPEKLGGGVTTDTEVTPMLFALAMMLCVSGS